MFIFFITCEVIFSISNFFDLSTCCSDTNKFCCDGKWCSSSIVHQWDRKNIKKGPWEYLQWLSEKIGKNGHFTWIVYVCVDCGHRIFGAVINGLEGGFGVNTKCVMYTIRFSFRSMANGGAWFLVFLWPEQIFCGVDVLRCIASFFYHKQITFYNFIHNLNMPRKYHWKFE